MAHTNFSSSFSRFAALSFLAAACVGAIACGGSVTGVDEPGAGGGASKSSTSSGGTGASAASCGTTNAGSIQECELPGDDPNAPTGIQECSMYAEGTWAWSTCYMQASSSSTPLVLVFDGAPVAFASSARSFDVAGTMSVVTDWPTARTPWLALDRDGNGSIDDGRELFGSATFLSNGERAPNGFAALAELDSDGDGKITPADAAWSSLRLWSDVDRDRVSAPGELAGLGARRVLSIDLSYRSDRQCDGRGNCAIERASFRWADEAGVEHTGEVVDVHLRHQSVSSAGH